MKKKEEMLENRIGEIIASKGYLKKYIAFQLGVSQNQVSNWVTGKSYPTIPNLFRLADLLGVKVDDLFIRVKDED
ncbi:helix-turn-helix domain-containing protein [Rossellomorea marisflavi]|uniref:helix-turn-helix domain-containing protein n=1 Tax=Rossellomorea marisflavi TaxID=189381 RepID=UPI00345D19F5